MSNPALNTDTFRAVGRSSADAMTLNGAILKTGALVAILLVAGAVSWRLTFPDPTEGIAPVALVLLAAGCLGGFVVALATIFVPRWSPVTAPLYAALEGLALGVLSAVSELRFPGVVFQAVLLTVGVLVIMLLLYLTRIIQPTRTFVIGLTAAMGALLLFYLFVFLMRLFQVEVPFVRELFGNSLIGIGFSVVVCAIAALNLIIDFGLIEDGVRAQAPKYMEWYSGFGLLVTLVWLYLEILRLLSKLRSR